MDSLKAIERTAKLVARIDQLEGQLAAAKGETNPPLARAQFCRQGALGWLHNASLAIVSRLGGQLVSVSISGLGRLDIPRLAELGIPGVTRVENTADGRAAGFMLSRAHARGIEARLGEHVDVVCVERSFGDMQREIEFVAALIEWGCGPLPQHIELVAYDRGVADARRAVAAEHAAALVRARADARSAAVATAASTSAELAELRAAVERQRLELARRPVAVDGYERAERQRAADADRVRVLAETWSAEAERLAFAGDERAARIRESWAAAARTLTIEIREAEVVR